MGRVFEWVDPGTISRTNGARKDGSVDIVGVIGQCRVDVGVDLVVGGGLAEVCWISEIGVEDTIEGDRRS